MKNNILEWRSWSYHWFTDIWTAYGLCKVKWFLFYYDFKIDVLMEYNERLLQGDLVNFPEDIPNTLQDLYTK